MTGFLAEALDVFLNESRSAVVVEEYRRDSITNSVPCLSDADVDGEDEVHDGKDE